MSLFGVRLVCFIVRNSFFTGSLAHPPVTLCDLRLTKIVAEKLNQHKFFPPPSNIVARREEFSHTLIARPVR